MPIITRGIRSPVNAVLVKMMKGELKVSNWEEEWHEWQQERSKWILSNWAYLVNFHNHKVRHCHLVWRYSWSTSISLTWFLLLENNHCEHYKHLVVILWYCLTHVIINSGQPQRLHCATTYESWIRGPIHVLSPKQRIGSNWDREQSKSFVLRWQTAVNRLMTDSCFICQSTDSGYVQTESSSQIRMAEGELIPSKGDRSHLKKRMPWTFWTFCVTSNSA
jgi:hypothetical protein